MKGKYKILNKQAYRSFKSVKEGKPFNVCYSIEMNEFRGESNLQLNVKDIKEK